MFKKKNEEKRNEKNLIKKKANFLQLLSNFIFDIKKNNLKRKFKKEN